MYRSVQGNCVCGLAGERFEAIDPPILWPQKVFSRLHHPQRQCPPTPPSTVSSRHLAAADWCSFILDFCRVFAPGFGFRLRRWTPEWTRCFLLRLLVNILNHRLVFVGLFGYFLGFLIDIFNHIFGFADLFLRLLVNVLDDIFGITGLFRSVLSLTGPTDASGSKPKPTGASISA